MPTRFGPDHPAVVVLKKNIAALEDLRGSPTLESHEKVRLEAVRSCMMDALSVLSSKILIRTG